MSKFTFLFNKIPNIYIFKIYSEYRSYYIKKIGRHNQTTNDFNFTEENSDALRYISENISKIRIEK